MAENKLVLALRKALGSFFSSSATADEDRSTAIRTGDPALAFSSFLRNWREMYTDALVSGESRADKYSQYAYLDSNLAEASGALTVYADNVVSGSVAGDDSYYVYIDEAEPNARVLEEIIVAAERRSNIKEQIWDISRRTIRDGDAFTEVIIHEHSPREYSISELRVLPSKEMRVRVDDRGNLRDPEVPFSQVVAGRTEPILFDWWRMIHWKVGSEIYGVDYSLFAGAALRVGRQLVWVDEALVLARLSRAWKRFAYMIDTGKLGPDEALTFVERFMDRLRSRRSVQESANASGYRQGLIDMPLLPDEDIGIPVGEGSKADVKELSGDMNVSNIRDVEYLQTKFFVAVTVPKAYVALEGETHARAVLSQIDVQFARQVRRRQGSLRPGLRRFYEIAFMLAGVDPKSFSWTIEFPEMATADETAKWEMMKLKAEISKVLVVDVGAVNTDYVLRELLGFDEEEISKYRAIAPVEEVGEAVEIPEEVASKIRSNPALRSILEDLQDSISYRLARAEATARKRPIGVDRRGRAI